MINSQGIPVMECPFCKKEVEIVTIQRDEINNDVVNVRYYHADGDIHFVIYKPVSPQGGLTKS